MSNPSAIWTASTGRFTLSTFTLRTDAVTYFSPGDGFRQVCKHPIIAHGIRLGKHPVHRKSLFVQLLLLARTMGFLNLSKICSPGFLDRISPP